MTDPVSRGTGRLSTFLLLCIAATWLIWGSTYLAIKYALISFPPFLQMGTRFVVAGAGLMVWMRWRGAVWPTMIQWRNAVIIGTFLIAGGMGGASFATMSVGTGVIVAFVAIVPLMMAALNSLWGIRPSRGELAGIVVGLAGVLLLTQGASFSASPSGLMAMILGTSCWSLGSVLSQRRYPLAPGATGFASEMLCGGIVLLLMGAIRGETLGWPPATIAVTAWLYLVIFGSLIAFNAYMVLLASVSAGIASSYTYVNPVIALLLGVFVAGETVTRNEWAASAVILIGVLLVLYSGKRSEPHEHLKK